MKYSKTVLSLLSSLAIVCTVEQTISSDRNFGKFSVGSDGVIIVEGHNIQGYDANHLLNLLKMLENSGIQNQQTAAKSALQAYNTTPGAPLAKAKAAFQTYNTELATLNRSEEAHKHGQTQGLDKHEKKFLEAGRQLTQKSLKTLTPTKEQSKRAMSLLTKHLQEKGLKDFFEKEELPKEPENPEIKNLEDSVDNLSSKLSEGHKASDKIVFLTTQYNLYRKQAGLPEVQHPEKTIEVSQEDIKVLIKNLTEKLYLASLMGSGGGGKDLSSEKIVQKKVPLSQKITIFETTYRTMGMDDEGEAKRNALIKEIFNEIIAAPEENATNTNAILKFLYQNQHNGANIGERQAEFARWYFETAQLHPRLRPLVKEFVTKYDEYLEAMAIAPAGEHWNIVRAKYGASNHFAKYTVNPENLKDHSYIKGVHAVPLIHLLAKSPMQLMDSMSVKNARIYTELLPHTPFEVLDALYYLFWKLGVKEREGKSGPENIKRSEFIRKLKEIHEGGEDNWKVTPLPKDYDPFVSFFGENKDGDYSRYWEERRNDIGELMAPPKFNMEGDYIPGSEENVTRSMDRDTFELEDKFKAKIVTSKEREPKVSIQSDEEKLAIREKEKQERSKEAEAKKQIKQKIMGYLKTYVGKGKDVSVNGIARTRTLNDLITQFKNSAAEITDSHISNFMSKQDLNIFEGEEKDLLKAQQQTPQKSQQELEAEKIDAENEALRQKEVELVSKIKKAITNKHPEIKSFIGSNKGPIIDRLKNELLTTHKVDSITDDNIAHIVETLTQEEIEKLKFKPTLAPRKPNQTNNTNNNG